MTKLAIIVPYRDREEHLAQFVPHMEKFLSDKKIDFKIFVVEQGRVKTGDLDKPGLGIID